MAIYVKILQSMAANPNGFEFHTLSTKFKNPSKKDFKTKPTSKKNLKSNTKIPKPKKSKEEEEAENDLGSYANLIYETIKNFFSGIIEIKGNYQFFITYKRCQNYF